MRLQGKVAAVTGAASGFGAGIARRFAAEGAQVALLDINGEGAREIAAEAGGGAIGADLRRHERRQPRSRVAGDAGVRSGGSTS